MATSTITLKTDTTANWESSNRVLVMNEPALERTENGLVNMKIGDGVHAWDELDYVFELATLQDIKDYITTKYNSVVQIADNLEDTIDTVVSNANASTTRANTAAQAAEDVVADKVGIDDTSTGLAKTYSSVKIQELVDELASAIGTANISSWKDVQAIVAAGFGAKAFPVGTQFATATTDTAFKDSSTGKMYWDVVAHQTITIPSVDCDTAAATAAKTIAAVDDVTLTAGAKVTVKFTNANTVASPTLAVGELAAKPIYVQSNKAAASGAWAANDVVEFIYDTSAGASGAWVINEITNGTKPAMILLSHWASGTGIMMDSPEVMYYCEDALPAGTYWFGVPATYGTTAEGSTVPNDMANSTNEPYYVSMTSVNAKGATTTAVSCIPIKFTTTKEIPAGGTIRLVGWQYGVKLSTRTITTYSGKGLTGALDSGLSISICTDTTAEGLTCLGKLENTFRNGNLNTIQRLRYGSNNWKESNMRQYLNANASSASGWYVPSTNYDTNGISRAGFIYGLEQGGETDFLSVVKPIRHITVCNNYWEEDNTYDSETDTHSRIGKYDTTDDTFWLASNSEIFDTKEGIVKDGTLFTYFGAKTNACRIKYNNAGNNTAGSAQNWWLRSPYVGNTNGVRYVTTSGAAYNNHASHTYRPAPACAIY